MLVQSSTSHEIRNMSWWRFRLAAQTKERELVDKVMKLAGIFCVLLVKYTSLEVGIGSG